MKSFTPYLWNRMEQLHKQNPISGHTPGHKNGVFLPTHLKDAWGEAVARYDYTELPGLDNLHFADDCIAQSQAQAAELFGAKQCFYLVNGTTAGLQAAIMATCSNKQVFVPRHVHRSIYHSLILAQAEPIYLPLVLDEETGLPLGISLEVLDAYIAQYPDCKNLILVNPTYQGITTNNVQCVQLAKQHNLTVIVDEAHGSHLHFHNALPESLLDAGADLVVQSWHKTLPVLTQGSALLVNHSYTGMSPEPFLSVLQTTSPSYLIMASLEAGSIYMGTNSYAHINQSLETIFALHRRIAEECKTLSVLWKEEWHQDPFKLYLISDRLNGADMDTFLREQFAIYSEMHDNNGILFILPLETTTTWAEQLFAAIKALDVYSLTQEKQEATQSFYCSNIPEQCMTLRDAFYAPKQQITWRDVENRIAGQFILRYPPGIPLVVPGERITAEIVQLWISAGGTNDETLNIIK